jgi:23S rRNA-/tRNA-specific pseudouridylate synthase
VFNYIYFLNNLSNAEVARQIRSYYNENKIIKQYLAITKNIPEKSSGEIDIPLIRRSVNGITRVNQFSITYSLLHKIGKVLTRI